MILLILQDIGYLFILYVPASVVFIYSPPREHFNVCYDTFYTVWNTQARVLNIPCLFTENSPQKFFLRGQLRFAFWRHFAHKDVAGSYSGSYPHDTALVEILQRLVADIRDVSRDLFFAELCVPYHAFKLFNVDRCEGVFFYKLLVHKDRVFVVVSSPGHEGDKDVLAERQLPFVC